MAEYGSGPRSGARDNGLRCAGYVAVGDLDPRIADALLDRLRDEGIAAYVLPAPGERGGYLELRLPDRPTDRLFADTTYAERAREVLQNEADTAAGHTATEAEATTPPTESPRPADTEIDFDAAWKEVLGSLQSGAPAGEGPWPASEEVSQSSAVLDELEVDDPALEDHFVPPPPPPLPRLRKVTIIGWLAIAFGIVLIVCGLDGSALVWIGALSILVGAGTLIWHVKDGPGIDSGWDDGAVL
ncbi:MAG TPA: hypothetical protein VMH41_14050 [Mycobacteriales bacterium]|nr:hypothetical protein [Mycobacteriales bacterium]